MVDIYIFTTFLINNNITLICFVNYFEVQNKDKINYIHYTTTTFLNILIILHYKLVNC